MNTDRDAHLNSALTESRQLYEILLGITPNLSRNEIDHLSKSQRAAYETVYSQLMRCLETLDDIFQESSLDQGLGNISKQGYNYYCSQIEPNRDNLEEILITLLDLHDLNFTTSPQDRINTAKPIWNILVSGYDFWSNSDNDEFDSEELRKVEKLLFSQFFVPDQWMENIELVRPVLGEAAQTRLPGDIRELLKENYRSFILGNYLSSITLSGSVLEYVLVERAPAFNIDRFSSNPKYKSRYKRLGVLVSEYADKRPEIRIRLEMIVESRNKIVHPKHKQKLFMQPKALQISALDSLTALREAVEMLYFD